MSYVHVVLGFKNFCIKQKFGFHEMCLRGALRCLDLWGWQGRDDVGLGSFGLRRVCGNCSFWCS